MAKEHRSRKENLSEEAYNRKKEYNAKYYKTTKIRIPFTLNKNTDQDILAFFDTLSNRSGYLKALIRKDMEDIEKHK